MKRTIKNLLWAAAAVLASCTDGIEVPGPSGEGFEGVDQTCGYVRNLDEPRSTTTLELRNGKPGTTQIYFGMTRPAAKTMTVTFAYDESALAAYNLAHATSYELYPADAVSLQAGGRALVTAQSQRSSEITVTVEAAPAAAEGRTYAVPLRVTPSDASIRMAPGEDVYMLLVKDMGDIPDATKPSGIKIVSCMEVNETNPLNNLEFTLKNSGKMLVDVVVLFSSNMNYDAKTGRVYISNNENIRHLLDNREKYIKPLQQRGIKVVLSMMGNHDRAGVAGLADETARAFARELKNLCEAYELDGIFWDDEYSDYAEGPGFVYPASGAAAARLIYETKQAMPDKLNIVYMAYMGDYMAGTYRPGPLYNLPDVDGRPSAEWVDYMLNDYRHEDLVTGYPVQRLGIYPEEYFKDVFNLIIAGQDEYQQMLDTGCQVHMIFAMDPTRANFSQPNPNRVGCQLESMRNIASRLFGDQLVWSGKTYAKDW